MERAQKDSIFRHWPTAILLVGAGILSVILALKSPSSGTVYNYSEALAIAGLGIVLLITLRRQRKLKIAGDQIQSALSLNAEPHTSENPEAVIVQGACRFPGVAGAALAAEVPGKRIEPLLLAAAGDLPPTMEEIGKATRGENPGEKILSVAIPTWPGSPSYRLVVSLQRRPTEDIAKQVETFALLAGGFLASGSALREYSIARTKLEELERQVQTARSKILREARSSLMGKLVTNIAHELNNPLAAVLGSTQLLEKLETNPQTQETLIHLKEEIFRCKDIVDQVTGLAEQNALEPQPMDLGRTLVESYQILHYRLRRDQIELKVDMPDAPVEFLGDEGMITHSFLNVGNVMADIAGCAPEPRALCIEGRQEEGHFKIRIRSETSDPDRLAQLANRPGVRLSLWVSGAIVEEHGGRLDPSLLSKGEPEVCMDFNLEEKTLLQSPTG